MKKFLLLDKADADACARLTFREFVRICTVISSPDETFDHEDAVRAHVERATADGDWQDGERQFLVIEEGHTRVADAKVITVSSEWGGWTHGFHDQGPYERPERPA